MKRMLVALLLALTPTASLLAADDPLSTNWQCRAMFDLAPNTAEAEKCAQDYLVWAVGYAKEHPSVVDALKARHASFLAYVKGKGARDLGSKLDEADGKIDAERVVVRLDWVAAN